MSYFNLSTVAAIPLVFVVIFLVSPRLNQKATTERDPANTLVILSGLLTALAILIPIGATFLPDGRFTWREWLLVGALLTGVMSLLCTIYSMIVLYDKKTFVPSSHTHISSSMNATWMVLVSLSLALVVLKTAPVASRDSAQSEKSTSRARFVIVRDLPELGTWRGVIETMWGTPSEENDHELLYRTKTGLIVFCLDAKGGTESITEAKEGNANAVRTYCN